MAAISLVVSISVGKYAFDIDRLLTSIIDSERYAAGDHHQAHHSASVAPVAPARVVSGAVPTLISPSIEMHPNPKLVGLLRSRRLTRYFATIR